MADLGFLKGGFLINNIIIHCQKLFSYCTEKQYSIVIVSGKTNLLACDVLTNELCLVM